MSNKMTPKNKEFYEKAKALFKKLNLIFSILSILLMLSFPIFSLITKRGNSYINIAVLVVTIIYGLLWLILGSKKAYKIDRIFKWSKLLLSAISLGVNIYSIYLTSKDFNIFSFLITLFMGAFWVFNVIFNILYDIVSYKLHNFLTLMKEEIADFKSNLLEKKNDLLNKVNRRKIEKSNDVIDININEEDKI